MHAHAHMTHACTCHMQGVWCAGSSLCVGVSSGRGGARARGRVVVGARIERAAIRPTSVILESVHEHLPRGVGGADEGALPEHAIGIERTMSEAARGWQDDAR